MSLRVTTCLLSAALLFVACRREQREQLSEGFHRAGAKELSADEAKAVEIARAHLDQQERKRIDARYNVTRVPEGFRVHVSFVTGYQGGQPIFIPGGFCVVLISTNWTVTSILGGS